MRLFALLSALVLPLAVAAQAPDAAALAAIVARLERPAVVRGDFEQSKQIAGLARPLVSRGHFVVARGEGILWDTLEPFPQRLRITASGIGAGAPEDGASLVGTAPGTALRELNRVLGAVFEADLAVLQEYFRTRGETAGDGWRLVLEPRAAALSRVFSGITLEGGRLVEAIELREANGDVTRIRFASPAADTALTQAERDALAP